MTEEDNKVKETEVFKKKWFAWVSLLVGGILLGAIAGIGWIMIPIFFYLIWKYQHHGKKMRIVITVFFSFVLLGAIATYGEDGVVEEAVVDEVEAEEAEVVVETAEEKAEREAEEKVQAEKEAEAKAQKEAEEKAEAEAKAIEEAEAQKQQEFEDSLTVAQKNAIRSAENYIDYTAFSKSGLVEQLAYEGYSKEDATLAVENIIVDWREQAVLSAENYLAYTSFSRSGLIKQLEFEGHSNEDANYAADQVGL